MPATITNKQEVFDTWPETIYCGSRISVSTSTGHEATYILARFPDNYGHLVSLTTGASLLPLPIPLIGPLYREVNVAKLLDQIERQMFKDDVAYIALESVHILDAQSYMLAVVRGCQSHKKAEHPSDLMTDPAPDYLLRKDGHEDK